MKNHVWIPRSLKPVCMPLPHHQFLRQALHPAVPVWSRAGRPHALPCHPPSRWSCVPPQQQLPPLSLASTYSTYMDGKLVRCTVDGENYTESPRRGVVFAMSRRMPSRRAASSTQRRRRAWPCRSCSFLRNHGRYPGRARRLSKTRAAPIVFDENEDEDEYDVAGEAAYHGKAAAAQAPVRRMKVFRPYQALGRPPRQRQERKELLRAAAGGQGLLRRCAPWSSIEEEFVEELSGWQKVVRIELPGIAFSQKREIVVFAKTRFPGFVETKFC